MTLTPTNPIPSNPIGNGQVAQGREGYGVGYGNYGGTAPYGPQSNQGSGSVDLFGAIMRRKFVVLLLGLIGTGLGYVFYTKTPELYSSQIKLEVDTRTHTNTGIDVEPLVQDVSTSQHQQRISSTRVLKPAIEKYLEQIKKDERQVESDGLLADTATALGNVKAALSVTPLDKSADIFAVTLKGPNPNELPDILMNIADTYGEILMENNKNLGEETVALIKRLQENFHSEKQQAENRYLELVKELGVEPTVDGEVVNPSANRLATLMDEQNELRATIRDLNEKIKAANTAVASQDDTQLRVLAIDARKHLGTNYEDKSQELTDYKRNENLMQDIRQMESRLVQANDKIAELQVQRQSLANKFGSGYSKIITIDNQIAYYRSTIEEVRLQKDELIKIVEQENRSLEEASQTKVDWENVRRQTEKVWIQMYLTAISRDHTMVTSKEEEIANEIELVRKEATRIAGGIGELKILQKQIEEKREAIRVTLDRLNEINLVQSGFAHTRVVINDPPGRGFKIAPNLSRSLGLGTFFGIVLGTILALLIDRADYVFRSPHEIVQLIGAPVLGRIPRIRGAKAGSDNLLTVQKTNSAFAESFRAARTGLLFAGQNEELKTILFTSPSPGDGKSTTACNLSISLAQAGKRVLLIDADFRRPRVHQYFRMDIGPGVTDYLYKNVSLPEVIRESKVPDLYILSTGSRPKNPGELVASKEFLALIESVREQFDFVLIDSPPILPVADSTTMASHVDGVMVVLRIRKGVKVTSQKAKESLDRVGAKIIGVIVNGIDENPHYNEYGYYVYPYSAGYPYSTRYYDKKYADYHEKIPAGNAE